MNDSKIYKIFVINPGSTSTKVSLHENEKCIQSCDVFHDSSILLSFPTINDQLTYRMDVLLRFIEENDINLNDVDAIVGRGGGCYSLESGTYEITDQLMKIPKKPKVVYTILLC